MKDFVEQIMMHQIDSLNELSKNVPSDLFRLAERIKTMKGRVVLTGIGKSGYIARKIAASLSSIDVPSFFMHAAEAGHGDLGMVTEQDLILAISNSGETKELRYVVDYCKMHNIEISSITYNKDSYLAKNSKYLLNIPHVPEAAGIKAPTTSAMLTMVLGDLLMLVLYKMTGFCEKQFAINHPSGKIGEDLKKII